MKRIGFYFCYLTVTEITEGGNQTTMLYAGPLPASEVVLPVGEFDLFAEIYDEANAYGTYRVNYFLFLNFFSLNEGFNKF